MTAVAMNTAYNLHPSRTSPSSYWARPGPSIAPFIMAPSYLMIIILIDRPSVCFSRSEFAGKDGGEIPLCNVWIIDFWIRARPARERDTPQSLPAVPGNLKAVFLYLCCCRLRGDGHTRYNSCTAIDRYLSKVKFKRTAKQLEKKPLKTILYPLWETCLFSLDNHFFLLLNTKYKPPVRTSRRYRRY